MLFIATLALLVASPFDARAHQPAPLTGYGISSWTEQDGLPSGSIWALAEDSEGFLWIGCDAGLVRFDGARFRTWQELGGPSLPAGPVRSIAVGSNGSIWLGFGDQPAITHILGRSVKTFGPAEGVVAAPITSLIQDRAGAMWAGTPRGLLHLAAGAWQPQAGVDGEVVALSISGAGDLVVATQRSIMTRAATDSRFVELASMSALIQSVAIDRWKRVWVTDRNIGYRPVNASSRTVSQVPRGKGYRLLPDSKGNLWIATYGQGVWRVRLSERGAGAVVQAVTDFQGLSNNVSYALLEDRHGSIWVGTTAGLNRLAPQRVAQLRDLGVVTGLEVTGADTVWANTSEGLTRFTLKGEEWIQIDSRPTGVRAEVMHADPSGSLWVANSDGLSREWIADGQLHDERISTRLRQVKSIAAGAEGTVWIYDVEHGLFRWHAGELVEVALPSSLARQRMSSIFVDRAGRLWLAPQGHSTVTYVAGATVRSYGPAEGFGAGRTRAFFEDRSGTVWVAGSLGLSRFANGRFTTLKKAAHLPLDSLTGVFDDASGALWIGSASGILRMTSADFDAALAGRVDEISAAAFDAADGVPGTTGWNGQPSAVRSGDGRLWFLTSTGVTILDPRSVQTTVAPAPVRVDVVSVDDQRLPISQRLKIPPRAARLQIEYTVPLLSAAQQPRFRYRLDGFDPGWINAGLGRTAVYTNLPPRDYHFQVQMQDASGKWRDGASAWQFSVQPAFYQTFWFIGACLALASGLAWGAWRVRVAQVRRHFAVVHGERARLGREIHDTLLQSLVGVALQCDALANATADRQASQGLVDLRRQVEEYVRECRQTLWNLRSPVLDDRDLPSALRHVSRRAAKGSRIDLHTAVAGAVRAMPGRIDEQLLRIGQEAVTNAVRHSRANRIDVSVDYTDDAVALTVRDDGCGFDPESLQHSDRGHWGLVGMQERAAAIGATIIITSRPNAGTTIVVTVSVPQLDASDEHTANQRTVHGRSSDRAGRDRADHQPAA